MEIIQFLVLLFYFLVQFFFLQSGKQDYKNGKNTKPISAWNIENYATIKTKVLQQEIMLPLLKTKSRITLEAITKFGAFASIFGGVFGMIFCLPFLFSSSMADLVGAGFPFIGGAILSVGGLVALSNLSKAKQLKPISV